VVLVGGVLVELLLTLVVQVDLVPLQRERERLVVPVLGVFGHLDAAVEFGAHLVALGLGFAGGGLPRVGRGRTRVRSALAALASHILSHGHVHVVHCIQVVEIDVCYRPRRVGGARGALLHIQWLLHRALRGRAFTRLVKRFVEIVVALNRAVVGPLRLASCGWRSHVVFNYIGQMTFFGFLFIR